MKADLIMMPPINTTVVCVQVIREGEGHEQLIELPDMRSQKPFGIHQESDNTTAFFQQQLKGKIFGKEISLAAPNEISISLSISSKARSQAIKLRHQIAKVNKNPEFIYGKDISLIYDYLEEVQKSVIFSYRAIEAFCNATIPDDYIYKKTNNKGIVEHYKKEEIERWISTSEKIEKIIPEVLNLKHPKHEKFWAHFKELELLRNNIIHTKSKSNLETLAELFSDHCDEYIKSSSKLLDYFISKDTSNQIFPLGFGKSTINVVSVENLEDHWECLAKTKKQS